jgi:hypothetical protein
VDPGSNANPAVDASAADASTDAQGVDGSTAVDAAVDGNGVVVAVSYQGQAVNVDLGTVATSSYKGTNLVKLSDLWTSTNITADRSTLTFEFVAAADGFKPSDKGCADLSGTVLDKGYIDPSSRNLTWDESLGFKGCYSVKGVGQINAHAATSADAGVADATAE